MLKNSALAKLDQRIRRGESIVMELAINASTYIEPDRYFLLKSSKRIQDIIVLLQLIEPETLNKCEIAYFDDDDDDLLGEFKIQDFLDFYQVKNLPRFSS